ncbi:MAG: CoA transferase, partial [Actinomycetota bacterium]|nr:CoA transferase [Actinomycetota bacterium]
MRAILEGIKVLDFTRVLSGPTATRYLLEMGAEVVKVEAPTSGDLTRNSVTQINGRSGYFATHNRGKRSI